MNPTLIPYLRKHIEQTYPQVRHFDVVSSAWDCSTLPVEYHDGYRAKEEYPPVAKWRIGDQRFSYVLSPKFIKRTEQWFWFSTPRVRTEPSYNDEIERVLEVVRMSAEGFSAEQINMKLHGFPNPPSRP